MSEITVTLVAPLIAGTAHYGYRTLAGVMVGVFGAGGLVASTMDLPPTDPLPCPFWPAASTRRHRSPSGIYDEAGTVVRLGDRGRRKRGR
ncbi:MAG: hypothetical protein R2699_09450 [Acidimicrobiales bacterium]